MPTTPATETLGVVHPIVQGPFGGGISSVALACAVSDLGGLGSFGAHHLPPSEVSRLVEKLRAGTSRPFAVNLWVPLPGEREFRPSADEYARAVERLQPWFDEIGMAAPSYPETFGQSFEEQAEALLEAAPPVWSFVFGVPSPDLLARAKKQGIVTMGTATTVDEARAIEAAGVDVVVATGSDAGGHRVSFLRSAEESLVGTFSLVPQVADAVEIPVVAAGGIGDGRGIAAALTLGAHAAQIGTLFLACDESGASEAHKLALVGPDASRTELTKAFSGRLARGIVNRFVREMRAHQGTLPPYPIQNFLTTGLRREAAARNEADLLALWAGQAATFAKRRKVADCFADLLSGLERARGSRV
jgi:nitronate monooxygenase